jgi:uncharacterized protein
MSRQVETDIARTVVDGMGFAREGRRLAGNIPVAALPRLADLLVDAAGELECRVRGEMGRDGKAYLVLEVDGSLNLRCQRCLGTVVQPVAVRNRLLLVPEGQDWPEDELVDDGFDAVEAGKEMALLPLMEEEVLLALPIAPRHEQCEPPKSAVDEQEPSPFAVLAKIRKGV